MAQRPSPSNRPTWAEIDLRALEDNYRALNGLLLESAPAAAPPAPDKARRRLIPVIKANAYGHGAVAIAQSLQTCGASMLAVAIVEEGAALRQAGISCEILVLEGCWPGQEEELLRHSLTASVYAAEGVWRLEKAAQKTGARAGVHIKVDTGMMRLGARWDALGPLLQALHGARRLRLCGVFSHLSCAEEADDSFTLEQLRRFESALIHIRENGLEPREVHLANSAGLLYHPGLRRFGARAGIALYGYAPSPERSPIRLKPVLSLKSRIGLINRLEPGESAGYNRRFIATRPTRAATIPAGYADGYCRALTGKGRLYICGRPADLLGTVSMDMIVADVTDIAEALEGTEVVLMGDSAALDAWEWARWAGTIPYEILCGISQRVPRIYIGS